MLTSILSELFESLSGDSLKFTRLAPWGTPCVGHNSKAVGRRGVFFWSFIEEKIVQQKSFTGQTHAMYLNEAIRNPEQTLTKATHDLFGYRFDAFVCCGVSGLLLAPMLALHMGKRLAVVRKKSDVNHSEFNVESTLLEYDRWIFIDDIIASGTTLHFVRRSMQHIGFDAEVGTYLYHEESYPSGVQNTAETYLFGEPPVAMNPPTATTFELTATQQAMEERNNL